MDPDLGKWNEEFEGNRGLYARISKISNFVKGSNTKSSSSFLILLVYVANIVLHKNYNITFFCSYPYFIHRNAGDR